MALHVKRRGVYPKTYTCYTGPYTHHERISCQMKFALLWPQHDMIGNHLSMISGSSGNDESVAALPRLLGPAWPFQDGWARMGTS